MKLWGEKNNFWSGSCGIHVAARFWLLRLLFMHSRKLWAVDFIQELCHLHGNQDSHRSRRFLSKNENCGYVLGIIDTCVPENIHHESESHSVVSDSFAIPWTIQSTRILQARIREWVAFPFSRGIFPTQGLNPGLPHCRWILYQLSHKGSPRRLEWVAYPFSRGSSRPRNWTRSPALQVDSLPTEPSGKPPKSLKIQ